MEKVTSLVDEVPHLDITIHEETIHVDVEKVINLLRPQWKTEQLVFECKSNGYINKNYHCHMGDGKDGLFVRLINTKLGKDFLDGAFGFMKYLRRCGIGAKLLCTFVNGLIMEYIHGEPITWQGFRRIKEERNWLCAARELARYHGTTNMDDIRELGIKTYKENFQEFMEKIKATLESGVIPKEAIEGLPSVDEIQQLMGQIYTQLEDLNAELCFCHTDPNPTNFIITDQGIMLIDYDSCNLDFAVCNIGYFFFLAMDITDIKFDDQPTEAEKDIFIKEYLEERRLIDPSRDPVTEKQIRYWKYLVKRGELLFLVGFVGALIISHGDEKKVDLSNSHACWNLFQSEKHILEVKFLDE